MARFTFIEHAAFLVTCTLLVSAVQAKSSSSIARSCWNHPCPLGYRCKEIQVQCIRAPCPPIPQCVKISGPGPIPGHSGVCPRRPPGIVGPCVVRCLSDNDCRSGQKCCGSCPRECTTVYPGIVVKPGRCPYYYPWRRTRRCGRRCRNDRDCNGKKKCCRAGRCGKMCMKPKTWSRWSRGSRLSRN